MKKKKEEGDYQDVIPNSGRGFMSFPCARGGSQRGGGGVGVCVFVCNRLSVSILPDWSWLWEDTGSLFRGRDAGGRLTYTEVEGGKRKK